MSMLSLASRVSQPGDTMEDTVYVPRNQARRDDVISSLLAWQKKEEE